MRKEKSCGVIVYKYMENDLYILLIKHNVGHWSYPKGHVEDGETEIETALRETKEETNIDVMIDSNFRVVTTYKTNYNTIKDVVYFAGSPVNFDIIPQEKEVDEIRWVKYENCKNIITYENDYKLLLKLKEYLDGDK